jgi:hypothetical protein
MRQFVSIGFTEVGGGGDYIESCEVRNLDGFWYICGLLVLICLIAVLESNY